MHRLRLVADFVSVSRAGARRRGRGERHVRRRFVGDRRRARDARDGVAGGGVPPVAPRVYGPENQGVRGLSARPRTPRRSPGRRPAGTWDPETGACSAATLTGGELLFNPGSATGSSFANLGKSRTSRVVVARDAGGESYLGCSSTARAATRAGAASGWRLWDATWRTVRLGRTTREHRSRGPAPPEDPRGGFDRRRVRARLGVRGGLLRVRRRQRASRAALGLERARAPEGAVLGPFPGTGSCASLRWELGQGVDHVEVGSYDNATGAVAWTDVTAAATARGSGVRLCARACADHCADRATCGACAGGEDDACAWCASTERCLARAGERLPGDAGRRRGVPGGVRRRRLVRGVRA